jgi:hypothetical protein
VNTGADLEAEIDEPVVERARERDRPGRDVERRKEPVSGGIDLTPTEQGQPIAETCVVRPQQLRPPPVAELAHPTGRVDDVREQDRREHAAREGLEVLTTVGAGSDVPSRNNPFVHRSRMSLHDAGITRAFGSTFVAVLQGMVWPTSA